MDRIYSFVPRELIEALGWTLFHSLWQGLVIAAVLGLLLLSLMKFSAHIRYIITMLALLLMVLWTGITFNREFQNATERAQIRQSILTDPQLVIQHFKEQLKDVKLENRSVSDTRMHLKWVMFKSYFQKQFPLIVSLWMVGMILLLFRFMGGLIVVQRMKYRQTIPVDEEWNERIFLFMEQLKIRKGIKVLQSYVVQMPVALGFLKPVILLPVGLLTGLSAAQVESIIAHELAHIARRDYLFNIMQSFVEILFFYHPAIWWISSIARTERENCCDDIAVELTGDTISYAKALANIPQQVSETQHAMAFSNKNYKLLKRVKRLLNPHTMKTNFKEGFIASCILFSGIILLTIGASASVKELNPKVSELKDTLRSLNRAHSDATQINASKSEDTDKELERLLQENKKIYSDLDNSADIPDNLEKELEVAFGDFDVNTSNEVLKGIKGALDGMDLNVIVSEAMKGARAALKDVDVNTLVNESLKNEMKDTQESDKIAQEAMKGAQAALEGMDINKIVNEALKGAEGALKEIDVKALVQESIDNEIESEKEKNEFDTHTDNKYEPIIKRGTTSWNNYRKENPQVLPNLSGISLSDLNLEGINLVSISLANASINNSVLNDADLSEVNGHHLEIKDCKVSGANCSNANFNGVQFNNNIMRNTNFKNADLQWASFVDCDLQNSDFRNSNLRGASFYGGNIDKCEFKEAIANKKTKFPDGFDPAKHGIVVE